MGDKTFAKALKSARMEAGVTQSQLKGYLADTGIKTTLAAISSFETGKSVPKGAVLKALEEFIRTYSEDGDHYTLAYQENPEKLHFAYLVRAYGDGTMREDVYSSKERAHRDFKRAVKSHLTVELIVRAIRRPVG